MPWPADWVGTFLNWINNGYPKGMPPAAAVGALFAARSASSLAVATATRVRKDITTLSVGELALLKQAFTALMAKDPSSPRAR
jgi:hypothetical protein